MVESPSPSCTPRSPTDLAPQSSPRQPRSSSKHRSTTNFSSLRLAPLSARFADSATTKKTSAPRSPYEEAADFTFARHDPSYIGGKSAPSTPGISRSGSRRHVSGGLSRRGSLYDDAREEFDGEGGDEGVGLGGMVKAKSEATLATRERLAGYGVPLRKRQAGQQQRSRTNGTTTPRVRTRGQYDEEDWLSRATTATNALLQESKGQTWLSTRDSSASPHVPSTDDEDADEGYEEMAASTIPQPHPRSAAATPRPQTWGSRFGSRPASRRTSRRGSVSRTPGPVVVEQSKTYFDHPALNEASTPSSSRSASPEINEAELEALTQNQATGFGGLMDRFMGFSVFGTAESEESGAEMDRSRDEVEGGVRRRAQLPPPPARQNTAEGEQVGLWEDAAWLLGVAGKALT